MHVFEVTCQQNYQSRTGHTKLLCYKLQSNTSYALDIINLCTTSISDISKKKKKKKKKRVMMALNRSPEFKSSNPNPEQQSFLVPVATI